MTSPSMDEIKEEFETLEQAGWRDVFDDPFTTDWRDQWFLDGEKAVITQDENGMDFQAGPDYGDDSCHAVLWTKELFEGDLKIEYEYTKLDDQFRCVTIIYIQATGSGTEPYVKDIAEWSELRRVPAMREYFNHMHTYHLSYAAWDHFETEPEHDYIRARRYMPEANGLQGTDLEPASFSTGLFKQDVPHQITIIKKGPQLYLRIKTSDQEKYCHWSAEDFPPVTEGRIGLRHMFTRSARYKNFRVSVAE
ncbi:DUF1961 family protein [Candidatus Sumerlaeota bacterium]|nr:DUF1961 family protein [Candidatus Sumerlaeota bacterium]